MMLRSVQMGVVLVDVLLVVVVLVVDDEEVL